MQHSRRSSKAEWLRTIGQELAQLAAFYTKGERYHESYRKNREAFRKLITERNSIAKDIRAFQKAQLERVNDLINWTAYRLGNTNELLNELAWQREEELLKQILLNHLEYAAEIGFMYAKDQTKRTVNASVYDKRMQKLLLKRAQFSAKKITDATKERLIAKLITEIELRPKAFTAAAFPLDISKLVQEAIEEVFDDLFKAKTIADSEIIDGIMDGAFHYAREADLKYKIWQTQEDEKVCPICEPLDGKRVKIDDVFDTSGGEVDLPPDPHLSCRCYVDFE